MIPDPKIYPRKEIHVIVAALIFFVPALGTITLWPGYSFKSKIWSIVWALTFFSAGFSNVKDYTSPGYDYLYFNVFIASIILFFCIMGWLLVYVKYLSRVKTKFNIEISCLGSINNDLITAIKSKRYNRSLSVTGYTYLNRTIKYIILTINSYNRVYDFIEEKKICITGPFKSGHLISEYLEDVFTENTYSISLEKYTIEYLY